jgi:hypothetical protein
LAPAYTSAYAHLCRSLVQYLVISVHLASSELSADPSHYIELLSAVQFSRRAAPDRTSLLGSSLDREDRDRPHTERVRAEGGHQRVDEPRRNTLRSEQILRADDDDEPGTSPPARLVVSRRSPHVEGEVGPGLSNCPWPVRFVTTTHPGETPPRPPTIGRAPRASPHERTNNRSAEAAPPTEQTAIKSRCRAARVQLLEAAIKLHCKGDHLGFSYRPREDNPALYPRDITIT